MVMPCNRAPFLHCASSSTRLRRKVRLFQRNFYRTNIKIYNFQAKHSFHNQTTNLIQTLKHLPSVRLPKRTVSYLTEATYKSDCCLHDARKRRRGTGRNRKKHQLAISPEPSNCAFSIDAHYFAFRVWLHRNPWLLNFLLV